MTLAKFVLAVLCGIALDTVRHAEKRQHERVREAGFNEPLHVRIIALSFVAVPMIVGYSYVWMELP